KVSISSRAPGTGDDAGVTSSGAEAVPLVREQPALDRERIAGDRVHESAERAMRADDAVTGNHERYVVRAACSADGARRCVQLARELAVGSRFTHRYGAECLPNAVSK